MSYNIELESGKTATLHTAGKYCDRDIIVAAIGGGGMKYATATVTLEPGTRATGQTVMEVTGLDFEPVFVAVFTNASISTSNTSDVVLGSAFKGLGIDKAIPMRRYTADTSWLYSSTSYVTTELTADGFKMTSKSASLYVGSSYTYIVFG